MVEYTTPIFNESSTDQVSFPVGQKLISGISQLNKRLTNHQTALREYLHATPKIGVVTTALRLGGIAAVLGAPAIASADGAIPQIPTGNTTCEYVLGFEAVHNLIPTISGNCLDNEQHNPANGDGLQHTVNGLMVWRKSDNFTAFTNGYKSWINWGGFIRERLNSQIFTDEAPGANTSATEMIKPDGTHVSFITPTPPQIDNTVTTQPPTIIPALDPYFAPKIGSGHTEKSESGTTYTEDWGIYQGSTADSSGQIVIRVAEGGVVQSIDFSVSSNTPEETTVQRYQAATSTAVGPNFTDPKLALTEIQKVTLPGDMVKIDRLESGKFLNGETTLYQTFQGTARP